jgi:hypothetical protein
MIIIDITQWVIEFFMMGITLFLVSVSIMFFCLVGYAIKDWIAR